MRLDTGFRLSTYLTVTVASGCLTYAEGPYLPGIAFFALPMAVLLVAAYCVEGRWSLSAQGANGLGLLISVGWVGWVIFFSDEFEDPLGRPPWPAVFLPYLGPMLMVLLLVKLFRPKGIRDYWYIHSIGLIEVAVGSVLIVESYFGTMLLGYILCAFWSLTLFYMFREANEARRTSGLVTDEATVAPQSIIPSTGDKVPWRRLGFWLAARNALLAVGVALVLFFVTPQYGTTDAVSFLTRPNQAQTGFANAPIDLKTTGRLEVDESVAFEVYVENADGTPKSNLSPGTRWRGLVMVDYVGGKWMHPGHQLTLFREPFPQDKLPSLSPEEFFITFHVNTAQSHGLFLAEPIVVRVHKRPAMSPQIEMPYLSETVEGPSTGLFMYRQQEDVVTAVTPFNPIHASYQQVTLPAPANGLSLPSPLSPENQTPSQQEKDLTGNLLQQLKEIHGIRDFTRGVLKQLIREGKLEEKDVSKSILSDSTPVKNSPVLRRKSRAKVARALSDYLALSGEYAYNLNLERQDSKLDPTEDFLLNVKQGHCERFATGLALMLRSAGIPCRLVLGFRGADAKNPLEPDNGWYVVRQSHAHAWVEALVGQENAEGKMELRWLTLDPSPLQEADSSGSLSLAQWWERSLQFLRSFWRIYILEYNTDQQRGAIEALWNRFALTTRAETFSFWVQREPYWLVGFAALLVGLIWLRRGKPRWRQKSVPAQQTAFYQRLLILMEQRCRLVPKLGQTPQEFAAKAEELLAAQKVEVVSKDLPLRIVELFYQARYGGMVIPASQLQEIDRQLDFLSVALKNGPRLAS